MEPFLLVIIIVASPGALRADWAQDARTQDSGGSRGSLVLAGSPDVRGNCPHLSRTHPASAALFEAASRAAADVKISRLAVAAGAVAAEKKVARLAVAAGAVAAEKKVARLAAH